MIKISGIRKAREICYIMNYGWADITPNSVPEVIEHRYCINEFCQIWDDENHWYLAQSYDAYGYLRSHLRKEDGSFVSIFVHRVAMIEFNGYSPDPTKTQVDHLDGDKSHNHISNFEWVTPQENTHRALRNDLCPHINCTLTDQDIHFICQQLKLGKCYGEISDMLMSKYGENANFKGIIGSIYRGESWTAISKEYIPFPENLDKTYYNKFKNPFINSVLDEEIIKEICQRLENGERSADIAKDMEKKYNLNKKIENVIGSIRQGRTFKNISCKYNIPKGSNSQHK